MGQYFTAYLKNECNGRIAISNYMANENGEEQYYGLKLMEHSYIGCYLMESICRLIYKNPREVAWIGDYADDVLPESHMDAYKFAMDTESLCELSEKYRLDISGKFIVNHTKKEFLDVDAYVDAYVKRAEAKLGDKESFYKSKEWAPHPLSLLTACGNGLGGGDYHGINEKLVGTWAFDVISIEDEKPEGFKQSELDCFCEER